MTQAPALRDDSTPHEKTPHTAHETLASRACDTPTPEDSCPPPYSITTETSCNADGIVPLHDETLNDDTEPAPCNDGGIVPLRSCHDGGITSLHGQDDPTNCDTAPLRSCDDGGITSSRGCGNTTPDNAAPPEHRMESEGSEGRAMQGGLLEDMGGAKHG